MRRGRRGRFAIERLVAVIQDYEPQRKAAWLEHARAVVLDGDYARFPAWEAASNALQAYIEDRIRIPRAKWTTHERLAAREAVGLVLDADAVRVIREENPRLTFDLALNVLDRRRGQRFGFDQKG